MRKPAAGKRYAKALFALAREEGRVDDVRREIQTLVDLFTSIPELGSVVYRPLHPLAERRAAILSVARQAGTSETVTRFMALLLDHHRMDVFPTVRDELERLANEAAGRVQAEVTAAAELPPDQLDRLRRALAARTQSDVQLDVRIDPSILGGVVAKIGDVVFDSSIRTQIAQMRANLMKGH
jgi:F-type H+-transporting ATPase subunit delta